MKPLEPGTEVMLKVEHRSPDDRFNPHYLLVEDDRGRCLNHDRHDVYALCDDGKTRLFQREWLQVYSDYGL